MSIGLSTEERVVRADIPARHAEARPPLMEIERKIAYFFLGITLCIGSFLIYGGRNEMPRIIRKTTPVHILHYDSMISGNAQKTY